MAKKGEMNRRDFFKLGALGAGAVILNTGCSSEETESKNKLNKIVIDEYPQYGVDVHENMINSFKYIFSKPSYEREDNDSETPDTLTRYQYFIDQNKNIIVLPDESLVKKEDYKFDGDKKITKRYLDNGKLNQVWLDKRRNNLKKLYPGVHKDNKKNKWYPRAHSSLSEEDNTDNKKERLKNKFGNKTLNKHIEDAFSSTDLPEELKKYLTLGLPGIESSFDNEKISNVGAKGIYQIMPGKRSDICEHHNVPENVTLDSIPEVFPYIAKELERDYNGINSVIESKDILKIYGLEKTFSYQVFLASWIAGVSRLKGFLNWIADPKNQKEIKTFINERAINAESFFYVMAQKYAQKHDKNLGHQSREYPAKIFAMTEILSSSENIQEYEYMPPKIKENRVENIEEKKETKRLGGAGIGAATGFTAATLHETLKKKPISRRDFFRSGKKIAGATVGGAIAGTFIGNFIEKKKEGLAMKFEGTTKCRIHIDGKEIILWRNKIKKDGEHTGKKGMTVQIGQEKSKIIPIEEVDKIETYIANQFNGFEFSKKDRNKILENMNYGPVNIIKDHIIVNDNGTMATLHIKGVEVKIFRKVTGGRGIVIEVGDQLSELIKFDNIEDMKEKLAEKAKEGISDFDINKYDIENMYESLDLSLNETSRSDPNGEIIDMDVFSVESMPYKSDKFINSTWRKQQGKMGPIQDKLVKKSGTNIRKYNNLNDVKRFIKKGWLEKVDNKGDYYFIRTSQISDIDRRSLSAKAKANMKELFNLANKYLREDFGLSEDYHIKYPIHSLTRTIDANNRAGGHKNSTHLTGLAVDITTSSNKPSPKLYKDSVEKNVKDADISRFRQIAYASLYKAVDDMRKEGKIIPNIERRPPHLHIMLYTGKE